jgi:hypothetical protein
MMVSHQSSVAYVAKGKLELIMSIDINKFHEMIGHRRFDRLRRTATVHGLRLKGELKVCEDCAVAKEQGKRILIKTGRRGVKHLVKEFI